ncbi:LOB domain-containing protein 25 [Humulus lupulus]|uniref:LOB domain-containing protein 25 n=1 Tax=Humulus lupulus TaxID=3486 RepID=UPI002B403469|nr:LOB domain-containing protein 25 [Humulus lupulus]
MMASSSSYSNSPCAACKFLRRKCMPDCIFAPYFPPEEPQKFANVHKIFGASNVSKLLNEVLPHQREDAVNSLAYEAEARMKDPVYGCVGAISVLQRQVIRLQKELDATNADLMRYARTIDHHGHGHGHGHGLSSHSSANSHPYAAATQNSSSAPSSFYFTNSPWSCDDPHSCSGDHHRAGGGNNM